MEKTRKSREVRFRHRFFNAFLKMIFWPFARISYQYNAKKSNIKQKGPFLILANHSIALDPAFIGLSFNAPIYFVASDQIFNLGFVTRVLKHVFNPISKTKSLSDVGTIKKMKKIIVEGGNVAILPEGNLTYTGSTAPLAPSIAKLVKFLNVPVIFYQTKGFYLSNPRWAVTRRHGKTVGGIKTILYPKDYNVLTNDELYEMIKKEFYYNCYDEPRQRFRGKKKAEGLERLLFICPNCHKAITLKGEGDDIRCFSCGYQAHYNEYGYLEDGEEEISLFVADVQNKTNLMAYLNRFTSEVIFKDKAMAFITKQEKKEKHGMIEVCITPKGMSFKGPKLDLSYQYQEIINVAIQGKKKLILYFTDGQTLFLVLEGLASPYKYLLVFQYYKFKVDNHNKGDKTNDTIDIQQLGLR
ncbi:MAG: lysophospholipid acyltransferase family protein [Bacilli bacterium]